MGRKRNFFTNWAKEISLTINVNSTLVLFEAARSNITQGFMMDDIGLI